MKGSTIVWCGLLLIVGQFLPTCNGQSVRGTSGTRTILYDDETIVLDEEDTAESHGITQEFGNTTQPMRRLGAAPKLDPADLPQPMFVEQVKNPLDEDFIYESGSHITIGMGTGLHETGLLASDGSTRLQTDIYGYGTDGVYTWPGKTFLVESKEPLTVKWENNLPSSGEYILTSLDGESVVDTTLHWAYSLEGYEEYSIEDDGVPLVPHLHGGFSKSKFDGNPEFFFGPGQNIQGPRYVTNEYVYDNDQPAALNWIHDHTLGITRLNVYAGLACLYILRDDKDTGDDKNDFDLPYYPYETALAIQDRMFKTNGDLFYPAYEGDPFYDDFIGGLDPPLPFAPGPTALAEVFGDVMLVNGVIWPLMNVEPRKYRLRLLNGCDSRFLVIQFHIVDGGAASGTGATEIPAGSELMEFLVIGNDQGLGPAESTNTLVIPNGSRLDIILDISGVTLESNSRIIMRNLGGDSPFGGDIPGEFDFPMTDRIMAFDVVTEKSDREDPDIDVKKLKKLGKDTFKNNDVDRLRRVALFEGTDEFGRLQPILGTVGPAFDVDEETPIEWPEMDPYVAAGLSGPIEGTIAWHSPTTEKVKLGDVEEWEIWNVSADAHPIHLHLVHFDVVGRYEINEDPDGEKGIYLEPQKIVQHNGELGDGFKILGDLRKGKGSKIDPNADRKNPNYYENGRADVVTALPGQITVIRAKFEKTGRYVWHCHILSHEDHEMMRVLEVVEDDENADDDDDDDENLGRSRQPHATSLHG